jgi:hypothetical protein
MDDARIGAVLLKMQLVTQEDLDRALVTQSKAKDLRLGEIFIAEGILTRDALGRALTAQNGLRSKSKVLRARAACLVADTSGTQVASLAREVKDEVRRHKTGQDHPAVPAKVG